jgi:hypothetical protein
MILFHRYSVFPPLHINFQRELALRILDYRACIVGGDLSSHHPILFFPPFKPVNSLPAC